MVVSVKEIVESESIVTGVDHLIIRSKDAAADQSRFVELFGFPVHWPVMPLAGFKSGGIRAANVDIEFLQAGACDEDPYLYGIAFSPVRDLWANLEQLGKSGIRHTPPLASKVQSFYRQIDWSVILLGGFLDEPVKAPYLTGCLAGASLFTKSAACLLAVLRKVPGVEHADIANRSMTLICHYHYDLTLMREHLSAEFAAAGGGPYKISRLAEVKIETAGGGRASWSKLFKPEHLVAGPGVSFEHGARNVIKELVFETSLDQVPEPVKFGNIEIGFARFQV
jgi:hypothetical protein